MARRAIRVFFKSKSLFKMNSRRIFLSALGLTAAAAAVGWKFMSSLPKTQRMPVLFIGHGSPMNAILPNIWADVWRDVGRRVPAPQAILAISAHWITQGGVLVTAAEHPTMTYDMGGFPPELYRIQYPAPGNPSLAGDIQGLLRPTIPVHGDSAWGFDHGTWVVLKHMFPKAEIPVIQLSIDYSRPPAFHYDLAKQLRPLRDRGVLIVASGNIVHNLPAMVRSDDSPFDWAIDFDQRMEQAIMNGNHQPVIDFQKLGNLARIAHPTHDHFLPLLYALGVQDKGEAISSICDGFQYKSVSMRSLHVG